MRFGRTQQYLPRAGTTRATPAVCKLRQVQLCRLVLPRTSEAPRLPRQQEPSSQLAELTPSEDTGRSRPELALCIPKAGHVGLEEVAGWPLQPQRPLASGRRPLSLSPAPQTLLNVPWEGRGAAWVQAHARRVSSMACVVWAALPTSGPAIEASGLCPPASAPRSHPKVSRLDNCSDGPSAAPRLRPTPDFPSSPHPGVLGFANAHNSQFPRRPQDSTSLGFSPERAPTAKPSGSGRTTASVQPLQNLTRTEAEPRRRARTPPGGNKCLPLGPGPPPPAGYSPRVPAHRPISPSSRCEGRSAASCTRGPPAQAPL